VLGLSGLGEYAMAEGGHCTPIGFYPISSPGVMGCAPIPGYGDSSQPSQSSPQKWQTRWWAIAVDGRKGSPGTAVGMQSKVEAESTAMMECRAKGGDNCEVAGRQFPRMGRCQSQSNRA
jgi:hypothetical protein